MDKSRRDLASTRERISYAKSTYMRVWYIPDVDSAFAPGRLPPLYKPFYDTLRTYSDPTGHWDVMDTLSPDVIHLAHGDGSSGKYFISIYRSSTAIGGGEHDASRDRVIQHCRNFTRYMRTIGEAKGRITLVAIPAAAVISGLSPSFCADVDLETQMPLDAVPRSTISHTRQQANNPVTVGPATMLSKAIGGHIVHALSRDRLQSGA